MEMRLSLPTAVMSVLVTTTRFSYKMEIHWSDLDQRNQIGVPPATFIYEQTTKHTDQ